MITEIFGKLATGVSAKKSITLKNNGGIIIIDIDESEFTSEMQKQLKQVDFNFYLNDGSGEPKKVVFANKSWNSDLDRAIAFNQVPADSMVEVVVSLDESYILANNLIPIQEFPIKVSISDENILSKSGGSGAIDDKIDAKINQHNTSSTAHEDIRKLVSKAVKYKGSVENYSDLPTNPEDGDMYNIENADIEHQINAGDNVVWVADKGIWDNLGGFIDLSQLQVMMDFPSWLTEVASDTTKTMADVISVLDKNVTTTGLIYMGGLSVSDLPENSMVQAETTIEVMKSSNGDPLYKFTVVSTNTSPYMWTATGYNGVFSGWQERPTSEDLIDFVKNTDYATATKSGVIKVSQNLGTDMTDIGLLYIVSAKSSEIQARTSSAKPIVPVTLNFAVKSALSDANRINDMTEEEKANARGVIGAINKDDLTEYVKNTDYATQDKGGVVKVHTGYGLKIGELGTLMISKANQEMIDGGTNETNPIVPANLNSAIKAALSGTNRISDMTEEEKTNARGVIGALGSADLTDYVKNTDFGDNRTKVGIVKGSYTYGFIITDNGTGCIDPANTQRIDGRTDAYHPITPATLDYAVRSVLPEVQTSLPETIIKNCIYDLGEQSTLSITLPSTSSVGDWLQFDFLSGDTATNLTFTSTAGILGYDLVPSSNTVYSLYLDWGIIGKGTDSLTYGWRFNYSEYPLNA